MAHSADEGRPWMLERLQQIDPTSMLDVGTGAGIYADMFKNSFPLCTRLGIEVWKPYIEQFNLHGKYHELIVADARELDPLPSVDVVILGDVLEHMEPEDAVKVWTRARHAAKRAVYLSIPVVHYPQGAEGGNPYQVHVVDDWTHDQVLDGFSGITNHWTGKIVGVYEAVTA
jgi:trans-aconitate methyltransferase